MRAERQSSGRFLLLAVAWGLAAGGCLSIKTEHEIKPIHITMDVNLKVQKELNEFLDLDK